MAKISAMSQNKILFVISSVCIVVFLFACSCAKTAKAGTNPPIAPPALTNEIDFWLTKADQSVLLQKQNTVLYFGTTASTNTFIDLDSTQKYQTVDGFGYTLTGGSAALINKINSADKTALLQELFGSNNNSIGLSYLRVSMGASDLNASVFSYDDMPAGQTDINLNNFSLSLDSIDVVPLLKEILLINPNIKILGSPWSPPVWMKDNGNSMGGSLLPQYYGVYANYFVKYIQVMKALAAGSFSTVMG